MPFASFLRFPSLQTYLPFLSLKNYLPFISLPKLLCTNKKPFGLSLSVAAAAMDSEPPCLLLLCGISSNAKESAMSLKNSNTLKLPDNAEVSIHLHSDTETPLKGECFRINSFMNSLSTTRFGQFLIWSPRLSSTHDLVSQNFCALPIGAVCLADVQFRGRGRSKNIWESPTGCLLFSFTVQMVDGRVVPLVQYVVSCYD